MESVIKLGDIIKFGGYDWRVLDKHKTAVLVVTEDIVEMRYYHHADTTMTWDKSDLRDYLNSEFYDTFDDTDKSKIIAVTNKNRKNQIFGTSGGEDTKDNIFLLSLEEYVRYFCDDISAQQLADKDCDSLCEIKHYSPIRKVKFGRKFSALWLRSPGCYDFHAVYVNANGCIKALGDRFNRVKGVRPALWLTI